MTIHAPDQDEVRDEVQDETVGGLDAPEEELGIHWPRFGALIALLVALLVLGGPKVLIAALAIGAFLVFHEAGHYLTARWSGMKVTEFYIGFGQRIFAFKRGETTFGVKVWIPFGAYVRIIGMNNLEEVDPADEHRTYRQAPWFKRVLTIVAGPATHFVTAFALLAFTAWFFGPNDIDEQAWTIENVAADSVLFEAGLQDGDRIVRVNGESTETIERFVDVVGSNAGQEVPFIFQRFERGQVVRQGETLTLPAATATNPLEALGFEQGVPEWEVFEWAVGDVTPLSAAAAAGIESGDRILSIAGTPTPYFSDVSALIPDIRGEEVEIEVFRDGENLTLETRIWERLTSQGHAGLDGVYLGEMIVSFEGAPVANYEEFFELADDRIGETVEVEVVYDSAIHTELVTINELAAQDAAVSGFLGISSAGALEEPLGVFGAIQHAPGQLVNLVSAVAEGVKTLVTTADGWRSLFALSPAETDLTIDPELAGPDPSEFRPRSETNANRPISIVGIVRLADQLDARAIIGLLTIMNLFFGLFNLVPLLPLDGGHIALATYERIRSFGRKGTYHADAGKLLPLTYVVVGFFLVVGVIAIVRDIVDPIQL